MNLIDILLSDLLPNSSVFCLQMKQLLFFALTKLSHCPTKLTKMSTCGLWSTNSNFHPTKYLSCPIRFLYIIYPYSGPDVDLIRPRCGLDMAPMWP